MALAVEWFEGFRGSPGGEEGWALLGNLGEARLVARSRTTRTESGILDLPSGPVPVHRKIYEYPGWAAGILGAFRTTFAAPGRARREVRALRALAAFGFAPAPVALAERRAAGFLVEARLAVRTVEGGTPLDGTAPGGELARAVGRTVGRVHAAGLGDLSLSPRNIVAARGPRGEWTVAKVDSGRLRPAAPGGPVQAADLADLLAGLEDRWDAAPLAGIRDGYAEAAGRIPEGLDAAMAGARERRRRRR